MEIKIRNVDAAAVAKIDELARKKGQSRNEYLRQHLERLSVIGEMKALESRYVELVKNISRVIENNTDELENFRLTLENFKK
ncbi:MAG: ribbon-helix-helix protein, CopG family [Acutalibacteraceae bacterium]